METWILHNPSRTIHALPAGEVELPSHVGAYTMAEVEIHLQIGERAQQRVHQHHLDYIFCPLCMALFSAPAVDAAVPELH